jgi:hypothetical protein
MKQYFCVLNDEPAVLTRYNDGRIDGFVYTGGAWKKGFDAGFYTMNRGSRRRAWTTAHVRELKLLARKKTPAKKIAKTLKRSEGATRQKAFIIGLSLDTRA